MPSKKQVITVSISILLLCAIIILVLFSTSLYKKTKVNNENKQKVADIFSLYQNGEYNQVENGLNSLVEQNKTLITPGSDSEVLITLAKANLLMKQGGADNENKSLAIQQSIAQNDQISGKIRSVAINTLVNYLKDRNSIELYSTIFNENWADLIKEGDKKLALRRLSQLSYNLYPNTEALMKANNWYGKQLLENGSTITTEQKDEYIKVIKDSLLLANKLEVTEFNDSTPITITAGYQYNRAISEATIALATNDPSFAKVFQGRMESIISLHKNELAKKGVSQIGEMMPFVYFYYASFLNEIYGSINKDKVIEVTENIVKISDENSSDLGLKRFIAFSKYEWSLPKTEKSLNYTYLLNLSNISPSFKEFLKENSMKI